MVDGFGRDPVTNTLVVVEGDRIAHIGGAAGSVRPDDTVIDAAGNFILPGLIDAHCHISLHQGALPGAKYTSSAEFCTLWAAHAIGRVLRAGVTSIAVPGGGRRGRDREAITFSSGEWVQNGLRRFDKCRRDRKCRVAAP